MQFNPCKRCMNFKIYFLMWTLRLTFKIIFLCITYKRERFNMETIESFVSSLSTQHRQ